MELDFDGYPKAEAHRGGNKVGWYYYQTREEAEVAAKRAESEAQRMARLGYDFGYCVPGEISQLEKDWEIITFSGRKVIPAGLWQVCVP